MKKRIRANLITFTTSLEINRALEVERDRIAHEEKLPGQSASISAAVRSLIMQGANAKSKTTV